MEGISNWKIWELTAVTVLLCMMPWISRALRDERRTGLEKIALALGFSFEPDARMLPPEILEAAPLFKLGHLGEASNLLCKSVGRGTLYVFDYAYAVDGGSRSGKGERRQTVAVFPVSGHLPQFQLYPEHLGHKIMQLFGYQDIDFADSPEFSSMYLLRGTDEAAVRRVFSVEARRLLSGMPGWHVEGGGAWLAVYKTVDRQSPDAYPDYIKQAGDISSVFGGPRA